MKIKRNEIEQLYYEIEKARIRTWNLMQEEREIIESISVPMDMVKTEVYQEYIKVTIKDILPRVAVLKKKELEKYWYGLMNIALENINIQYEKALCVIKVFNPAPYWDTDNRSIHIIINSLRYNQIIKQDTFNNLSYMVMGDMDYENPRTEIYLLNHPESTLFFL